LVAAPFRVANCDQVEDPKLAKKLVRREIARLVTPGTAMDAAEVAGAFEHVGAREVLCPGDLPLFPTRNAAARASSAPSSRAGSSPTAVPPPWAPPAPFSTASAIRSALRSATWTARFTTIEPIPWCSTPSPSATPDFPPG